MIKVGLIGEDIAGIFLDDYPLKVEKLALINGEGSLDQVLTGKDLSAFLDEQTGDNGLGFSKITATLSLVLQGLRSYDEVAFSIVLLPVYPPTESMLALTRALQWMQEEVAPDFLQITYSSPEARYQQEQGQWVAQLMAQGCEVIAPVGAPPSFPSALPGVVAVSDKGFLLAGFDNVKTDVIIEEEAAIIYHRTSWQKQGLSTELASAIELKKRVQARLSELPVPKANPVILPDLERLIAIQMDLEDEDFELEPEKPGLVAKGKSYLKSVLSRIITPTGKVPAYIKEIRRMSCNGDDGAIAPCLFREESQKEPNSFVCGACGCGDRESVLVGGNVPRFEKLDYPFVSCPASMPGFSNYVPSAHEARPNEHKAEVEAKYGKETLDKAMVKQAALSLKLEKRLGWINKL